MMSGYQWVKESANVSTNLQYNLAQGLATFHHYIKQCVLCMNTFHLTAFPSQQDLALNMRETRRTMWLSETEKGITEPNLLLCNGL